jgi:hypothetical protein
MRDDRKDAVDEAAPLHCCKNGGSRLGAHFTEIVSCGIKVLGCNCSAPLDSGMGTMDSESREQPQPAHVEALHSVGSRFSSMGTIDLQGSISKLCA